MQVVFAGGANGVGASCLAIEIAGQWIVVDAGPNPSVMSVGVSSCANWNIKRRGMVEPWSKLIGGTHPPNVALSVGMCSKPSILMNANGRVRNVTCSMTAI